MVKVIIPKKDWKEIKPIYKKSGVQYYLLRVNKQDYSEDSISCIEDVFDHEPTDEDKLNLYNAWLNMEKMVKITEIEQYDISDNVNIFEVNNIKSWLDKATRVGLKNSLSVESEAGHINTTLYLNGIALKLPIVKAIELLNELELYAIDCYRVTEQHKQEINNSNNIEFVNMFDVTNDYPSHPVFNID